MQENTYGKMKSIINEDIAPAIPNPCVPYANKQIGKPILPVLGIINGGSSIIISFLKILKITPIKENQE